MTLTLWIELFLGAFLLFWFLLNLGGTLSYRRKQREWREIAFQAALLKDLLNQEFQKLHKEQLRLDIHKELKKLPLKR